MAALLPALLMMMLLPSGASAQNYKQLLQPDYTQLRGLEVKQHGSRLTSLDLIDAFAGRTHHGTYIYNRENEITAYYTETHFDNGTVHYQDRAGVDTGRWSTPSDKICYSYDSPMAGGCYQIWEFDGCYYFFNSQDMYDGYSVTTEQRDRATSCIPLLG